MKTQIFNTSEMLIELERKLEKIHKSILEMTGRELEKEETLASKMESKIVVLKNYPGLTVTVRKFSARQKDLLEQVLINPAHSGRTVRQEINIPNFKRDAIKYGVVSIEPRIVDMVKIKEAVPVNNEPEIWQIKDEVLSGDNFDWDLRDLLLEMIDEVNPKNWM